VREASGVHKRELRIGAARPRITEYFFTDLKAGDTFADGGYPSGDVPSGYPWELQLKDLAQETTCPAGIDSVEASEMVLHEHLSRTGLGHRDFFHLQRLFIIVNS
jgi:hypothetical protein